MTPERCERVEEVYWQASELPGERRVDSVRQQCQTPGGGVDELLEQGVLKLLSVQSETQAGVMIDEDIVNTGGFDAVNISMGGEAPLSSTEKYWLGKVGAQYAVVAAAGSGVIAVGAAVHRPALSPESGCVSVLQHGPVRYQERLHCTRVQHQSTMPTYPPPDPKRKYVQHRAWMPALPWPRRSSRR